MKNIAIAAATIVGGVALIYGGYSAYNGVQSNRAAAVEHCAIEGNTVYTLTNGREYDCEKVRNGVFSAAKGI